MSEDADGLVSVWRNLERFQPRPTTLVVSPSTLRTLAGLLSRDVASAVAERAALPARVSITVPLTDRDVSWWLDAPVLTERDPARYMRRTTNAYARERWRERVLERLYGSEGSTYERPCAACGGPGPWFVCLLCSTGMPSTGTWRGMRAWRIRPGAAARIRARMAAGAHVPKMPGTEVGP